MSSNIFGILHTGRAGLMASQISMDITGNNIVNANTDGYSRKRLNQAAAYRRDPNFGSMGYGVSSVNIERMRDAFIDKQLSISSSTVGYFKQLDFTMARIEDLVVEPSETGLNAIMNRFWNSWQDLANNPSDFSSRAVVLRNAETLISKFAHTVNEMRRIQDDINSEMDNTIRQINQHTSEIYKLNKEIVELEIGNQNANDARDRRDEVIKQLSSLIDIDYIEDDRGVYNVTIDGNLVASVNGYFRLKSRSEFSTRYDGTTKRTVDVVLERINNPLTARSGQMAAYIRLRDEVIEEKINLLDNLAYEMKNSINSIHQRGFSLDGITGMYFFDPNSQGATDMSISAMVRDDLKNIAAARGATAVRGTDTITVPTMPEHYGTPLVFDNTPRDNLVMGSIVIRDNVVGRTLQEGTDFVVDYARGTISLLSPAIVPNGRVLDVEFEYQVADARGPGDGSNALEIANLREEKTMIRDVFGNFTQSFHEFYDSIIGKVGAERQNFMSNLESSESIHLQYETRQDNIAGVSLDEEMMHLIKFRHSYQASARVISTVEKMLEVLMTM